MERSDSERATQFEDIRITGLDKDKVHRPRPENMLYNVYLKLSAAPPAAWVESFKEQRSFPRHSMWRDAWVDGQYIVVYCPLDELERHHLKDLRQDVAAANQKYRELLRQKEARDQGESELRDAEKRKIDETLDKLRFD